MRSEIQPDLELIRNASLVLGVINVYQPIMFDDLVDRLGVQQPDSLRKTLRFLVHRRLIRELPHGQYRATWQGQSSMWSRPLRKSRDVQRLWHLANLSDRLRKEGEEGDPSQ